MFKKLRIKLTLINVGIVMAILLIVFAFVFISTRTTLTRQVNNIKRLVEKNAITFKDNADSFGKEFSKFDENKTNVSNRVFGGALMIIEADDNGLIEKEIVINQLTVDKQKDLYELVKNNDKDMKYVQLEDQYLMTFFVERETTKYYFVDATQERELVTAMAKELLLILLAAIILTLIGNLFMIKKALEPVKKSWEKQKQFVGDASHELRTPISSIKINMEIISEDGQKTIKEHKKWIDNVNQETKRMESLVSKLLFLSRKDSTEQVVLYEMINIADAIELLSRQFEEKFMKKGIDFKVSLQDTYVKIDRTDLNQLISSLLDNALKYTEKGGVVVWLTEEENYAIIKIQDTGIGISKEDQAKVYERFYRADKARSNNGGYGLGLAIVKSIVENYKGKIEIESTLHKGTTFVVKLPIFEKKRK